MPSAKKLSKKAPDECFVEEADGLVLLCRKLPSGRVVSIDAHPGPGPSLLEGGFGIAHLNMDTSDNAWQNLRWVNEKEARRMLGAFVE